MIAASHRVLPTHLNQNLDMGDSDDLLLHDMTAVVCSLQGLRFLLVSVYMTVGAGLNSSVNDGRLQQLAGLIAAFGLPWVAVGDWNCSPLDVEQHAWSVYNNAVVLTAGTITCTSSEKGSLLDFVVCDRTMVPWIKVDMFHNVPWKPHLALKVEVAVPKQPIWIRTQIMPPKFDLPRLTQKQRHNKLADEGAIMDAKWLVAKDKGTAGQSWSYG